MILLMSTDNKIKWYQGLTDQVNTLAEEFGLDDGQSIRFRDFTFNLAREQYRTGNKSGASWAFKQAREGGGRNIPMQPAT